MYHIKISITQRHHPLEPDVDLLPDYDVSEATSQTLSRSRSSSPHVDNANTLPQSSRIWTREDRNDLNKLGTMISSFLEVPQFAAGSKVFNSAVISTLLNSTGPRPGSIQVLTQVMEGMMLRHRCVIIPCVDNS